MALGPEVMEPIEGETDVLPLGFSYTNDLGETVELTNSDQDWIASQVSQKFERLDTGKSSLKRRWTRTEKAIRGVVSEIDKDRFYGLVPFGKQTVQTLISHFWGRSLQTPKIFFSVQGTDEESQDMAPIHKENLLRHCDKDKLRQKLDRSLHLHGLPKGVTVFHVGYCQSKQTLYGPSGLVDKWETGSFSQPGEEYREVDQKIYDGATVKVIDPYDFVFDTDAHEDWDSCFKAYRSWWVYEDIAAEDHFSNYEELKDYAKDRISGTQKAGTLNRRKKKKDTSGVDESGRIEMIEFHGDIRLRDGTYLRNWTVVIGARQKVIRFERNPYFINPFVKWCYEDTEDGWGISPVDYILPFIDASSILLSAGVEGAKLNINPPWLADESHFQQKKHFLTEGMVIKYKTNPSLPNQAPTPIQFKYDAPFPYVQLFEGQSEAVTGATRQLSGNVTTNDKVQTATEFQGLQVVGNLIIDRLVDLFNVDCKIPIIQKVALINAMFNPEEKSVPITKDDGTLDFQKVPQQAYFGNYDYLIEDNKSEMERKQNLQEKLQLFFQGMQHPLIAQRAKALDLWKELWRDFGYGQPGLYIMDDEEFIQFSAQQMATQQFIQVKAEQAYGRLLQEEGAGVPIQQDPATGLPVQVAADQANAGGPNMEAVQSLPG